VIKTIIRGADLQRALERQQRWYERDREDERKRTQAQQGLRFHPNAFAIAMAPLDIDPAYKLNPPLLHVGPEHPSAIAFENAIRGNRAWTGGDDPNCVHKGTLTRYDPCIDATVERCKACGAVRTKR
jgi:hypothetical protein